MTRICIVGNSHVAALKLGWDKLRAESPGIEITFFGVPGRWLRDIDVGEGEITPHAQKHKRFFEKLSGGSDTIRLADYDAFVVVGLELSLFRWLLLYKQARYTPFNLEFGTPQILDAEAFAQCRAHIFEDTSGGIVYRALVAAGAAPASIHICPQPMPSVEILNSDAFWQELMAAEQPALIAQAYRADLKGGFAQAGSVVWQPDDTIRDLLFTDPAFSHGSHRIDLKRTHDEEDHQHMNADFGERILRRITETVAA